MSVGHSEVRAASDPAFWAWGGTPAQPDLDRLNPVFFHGLDALFRELRTREMNVELLLLNFYVLSQQTSTAYGAEWIRGSQQWHHACAADNAGEWFTSVWDETLNCWTGDVPGANRSIAADRI
jgi:hypothetical protein